MSRSQPRQTPFDCDHVSGWGLGTSMSKNEISLFIIFLHLTLIKGERK